MEYLTFPQSIPITAISKIKAHSYERDGAVVAIIMLIISRSTFVRGQNIYPIFSFVFPRSCCNTSLFKLFSQQFAPNKSTQPCYKCRPHNHNNQYPPCGGIVHGIDILLCCSILQHGTCPSFWINKISNIGSHWSKRIYDIGQNIQLFTSIVLVPAIISARNAPIKPPTHIPQCIPMIRLSREIMTPIIVNPQRFGTFARRSKNTGPGSKAAPMEK